jgi:hypothetical protein
MFPSRWSRACVGCSAFVFVQPVFLLGSCFDPVGLPFRDSFEKQEIVDLLILMVFASCLPTSRHDEWHDRSLGSSWLGYEMDRTSVVHFSRMTAGLCEASLSRGVLWGGPLQAPPIVPASHPCDRSLFLPLLLSPARVPPSCLLSSLLRPVCPDRERVAGPAQVPPEAAVPDGARAAPPAAHLRIRGSRVPLHAW